MRETAQTLSTPIERLTKWEDLLCRISAYETTSKKETVEEMWSDLHEIKSEADIINDNSVWCRASDSIAFMQEHFYGFKNRKMTF